MSELKPYMLKTITNAEEAVDFILQIYLDRKMWHFDDDPKDFVSNDTNLPAFTDKQVEYLRERQLELFEYLEDPHRIPVLLVEQANII
jgi:hypothetical protein